MGTSKGYGGPSSGLVPSWVDGSNAGGAPALSDNTADNGQGQSIAGPAQPDAKGSGSFSKARSNFTRFAKTGNRVSLGRALSGYVRQGIGSSGRAARRMGSSRATGSRLLSFIRDVQQKGATEALRQLNLATLADKPASDVFIAMLEFLCPPGGAIDEAIARQAMLETIAEVAESDVDNFDSMTPEQMQEFFLDFVARSIEGRVMADLAAKAVVLPGSVSAVESAQEQLHDFVVGHTRGQLFGRLTGVENLNDRDIEKTVDEIYAAAFELIAIAGETEK